MKKQTIMFSLVRQQKQPDIIETLYKERKECYNAFEMIQILEQENFFWRQIFPSFKEDRTDYRGENVGNS